MLYLIGGPARVGKTTLATRLMRELGVPFVPADILTHALDETYPEHLIRRAGWSDIPDRFYPFLRTFAEYAVRTLPDYCIEGDSFLPEHVSRLAKEFDVKVCFLGNSRITLETLLQHAGHNDWMRQLPKHEQRIVTAEIAELSSMFESEAARRGHPYFDVGSGFDAALDAAYWSLVKE